MTDREIARRIIHNFLRSHMSTTKAEDILKANRIDLSGAFMWANTKEGYDFWSRLYGYRLRDRKSLREFLLKNFFCVNNSFIPLYLYVKENYCDEDEEQ